MADSQSLLFSIATLFNQHNNVAINDVRNITMHRGLLMRVWFSVSKFDSTKDYYKVLGVKPSSDSKGIKQSFLLLAKKYHPDSNKGTENKFKEINEAYQVLSNDAVRREYDQLRTVNKKQTPKTNNSSHVWEKTYYHQNTYRGYESPKGWNNEKTRQQMMGQMLRRQQQSNSERIRTAQRNRANYQNFADMYAQNQETIRRKHEQSKKLYQEEERRRKKIYQQYKQEHYDYEQAFNGKISELTNKVIQKTHNFGEFIRGAIGMKNGKKK